MAISNYGELKTEVLSWNWGRNSARVDSFCRLAHADINKRLQGTPTHVTVDYPITTQRQAAPADMKAAGGRLYIEGSSEFALTQASPDQIADQNAFFPSGGQPSHYAIESDDDGLLYFVFAPAPTQSYTGKLLYERRHDFFADDAATNFILTTWPNVYLYGALLQAALYADDDARVTKFGALFDKEIGEILDEVKRNALAGAPLQMSSSYVV